MNVMQLISQLRLELKDIEDAIRAAEHDTAHLAAGGSKNSELDRLARAEAAVQTARRRDLHRKLPPQLGTERRPS